MNQIDNIQMFDEFGRWTVIGRSSGNKMLCRCKCGVEKSVNGYHLLSGASAQCLCCRRQRPIRDLSGVRVGHLRVKEYSGIFSGARGGKPTHHWLCVCDCGNEVFVRGDHLSSWAQKKLSKRSCGCMRQGKNNWAWRGYKEISGQHWSSILKAADERNFSVQVTIKEAWELFETQGRKCALAGYPLTMHEIGKARGTASLDRIDSTGDYTLDNIQWVHKDINMLKNDYDQDYFVAMCIAVAAEYERKH